jgi:hypothetical protein
MRRAARFADGVFLLNQDPISLQSQLKMLGEEADAIGRPIGDLEVTVDAPADRATAEAYRELGVSRFVLATPADDLERVREVVGLYLADVAAEN